VRETKFRILVQGDVQMAHDVGYLVAGGSDVVAFFVDPRERAFVGASTSSDSGCPVVHVETESSERSTEIEFTEFKGWRFHAGGAGKSIAICLVREGAEGSSR